MSDKCCIYCFVNLGALIADKLATVTAVSCCQRLFTCHCKKAFVILTIAFVTRVATVD